MLSMMIIFLFSFYCLQYDNLKYSFINFLTRGANESKAIMVGTAIKAKAKSMTATATPNGTLAATTIIIK